MKIRPSLLSFLLFPLYLGAQGITGSISGTVTDPSSLGVPGAVVVLTQSATATQRKMNTDSQGDFIFSSLPPGEYSISVEQSGFKVLSKPGIHLTASERLSMGQLVLQIGDTAEKLTVTAEAAAVQTASSERAGVITAGQVENIPIKGRNVTSLVQLLPGVVLLSDPDALSRTFSFATQGNNTQFNSVSLDGALLSQQDVLTPTVSQDSIAEVKVLLTNYQAEYGRLSGANVQLISKSGTREFHGAGSYYKRHEQWNANDFFNNRLGRSISRYRYNTWNYNIGGPAYIPNKFNRNRDKLFFFWSQEGWPLKTSDPAAQRTVPTELERTGDFSQSRDQNGALIPVTDPTNRQPFPGNRIPASRLDPNGVALLKVFPQPNFSDTSISKGAYNYIFQASAENPLTTQTLKLDYNINSQNLLFGNYTWSTEEKTGAIGMGGYNSSNWPQMTRTTKRNGQMVVLRYQHIFTPRLISESTFGYSFFPEHDEVSDAELARNQREPNGYALSQFVPSANPLNILPAATFGGVPNAANLAVEQRLPQAAEQSTTTVSSNLSYNLATHVLKAGFYFDRLPRDSYLPLPFNGSFDFGRNANNPMDTGYAYANAALGVFSSYTEANRRVWYRLRTYNAEWFLQDTWKVTRRLTLDYGVRFYYISPQREADNTVSGFLPDRFDPAQSAQLLWPARVNGVRVAQNRVTGEVFPAALIGAIAPGIGNPANGLVVAANDSSVPSAFVGDPGIKVGPRFGFAFDPTGKGRTAIRSGFGLFYGRDQSRQAEQFYGQAPVVNQPIIYYGTMSNLLNSAGSVFPPTVYSRDFTGHLPTTMNFSFSVQHNVGAGIVVDAGYVGSLGRHLWRSRNLNWIPFGANFNPENADPSSPSSPLPPSFLRPYQGLGNIPRIEYDATSNYNAFQLAVNRRFTRGVTFGFAWTWSKAMDYGQGSSVLSSSENSGTVSSQVPTRNYYSLADIDRTHVVRINWVWDLPQWRAVPKALNPFVNGWQISGITSFISGAPRGIDWSTTYALDVTGSPTDSARIVVLDNPVLPKDERTFSQNFRTDVFRVPAVGTIGNAARTLVRLPGINNWDAVVAKNIQIRERVRVQLRCELYNAFNHTQFSSFDTTARFDQSGNQVNGNFGAFTAATNPRRLQLALRASF
jgi:hypothetical protein